MNQGTTTPPAPIKEEKKRPNLRYQRDKDREQVKGVFKFYEVPGGTLSFVFRKYKEDAVEHFTLVDGKIYTLPLGVAKHLNKNGWYPEYEYSSVEPGLQGGHSLGAGMRVKKKIRRFGFQSLEFVDVDDLSESGSPVVEVELSADKVL